MKRKPMKRWIDWVEEAKRLRLVASCKRGSLKHAVILRPVAIPGSKNRACRIDAVCGQAFDLDPLMVERGLPTCSRCQDKVGEPDAVTTLGLIDIDEKKIDRLAEDEKWLRQREMENEALRAFKRRRAEKEKTDE